MRVWKRWVGMREGATSLVEESLPAVLEQCRSLLRKGRGENAMALAIAALARYPHSVDLRDVVRATHRRVGKKRLLELEAAAKDRPGPRTFQPLLQYLLDAEELDAAVAAATRTLSRTPDRAWAHHAHGLAHWERFRRERVAADGAVALRSFERAIEIDDLDPDYRIALARLLGDIGGVGKALFHLYRAQDLAGGHSEVRRMIEGLMLQDPETESVGELLRRYEEADAAGSIPGDEDGHDFTAEQLTGEARTLASIPGVRRLALSHPNSQCVVRGERVLDAGGEESAFHDLAVGFRRSASVSAKRLGIGQFQEAELEWDGGALLAFSGGRTVLTVEMTAEVRRDGIRDTARVMVGSWSESRSAGAMSS